MQGIQDTDFVYFYSLVFITYHTRVYAVIEYHIQ